ncbi:MAG: hypothetical protein L3J08_09125 [Flavobacteriaceae bacterium]|nr:hypothetical protein [Flavobacteriaceae bacterium]
MLTLNKIKWILLIVIATLVFFIMPKSKTKLSIQILMCKTSDNYFQLFYKNSSSSYSGSQMIRGKTHQINSELSLIEFTIPDSANFSRIRIDFGENRKVRTIKNISISGYMNKYEWNSEQIISDYRPINVKFSMADKYLQIIPTTTDPYIIGREDIDKLIDKIRFKSALFSSACFIFLLIITGYAIILLLTKFVQRSIKIILVFVISE